jgi:hypothetical protein
MNKTKFVNALKYPFKKLEQGFSLLLDAALPKAAQEFIADKKRPIFGGAIVITAAAIVVAPTIFPLLFAGTMVFNLISDYCEEKTTKRKNAEKGAEPVKAVDTSNKSAEGTSFKPNALSPDFKSALTNASPEAANSNATPADQTSAPKRPDNRAL